MKIPAIAVLAFAIFAASCMGPPFKGYSAPERPDDQIAIVKWGGEIMKAIRRIALLLLVGASLTVVLPHRQSHADHRQTYGCRGMGCGGVLMYLIVKGIVNAIEAGANSQPTGSRNRVASKTRAGGKRAYRARRRPNRPTGGDAPGAIGARPAAASYTGQNCTTGMVAYCLD